MQLFYRKPKNYLLVIALLLLTSSCGASRSTQCQRLANAANKANSESMAVFQSSIGQLAYNPTRERELAQVREQAVKNIEAVEVSDKKLQKIRSDLADAYQKASVTAREVAELMPTNGRVSDQLAEKINKLRLKAEEDIPPAIHELKIYCIGG